MPSVTPIDTALGNIWTTFTMPLRECTTLPGRPIDIARFIASSLTFMKNLKDVSIFFDEHCLVRMTKSLGIEKTLAAPSPNLDPLRASKPMMRVQAIESRGLSVHIHICPFILISPSRAPNGSAHPPLGLYDRF